MSAFSTLLRKLLSETAVCWPISTHDNFGKQKYGAPFQFKCRWEDVQEMFFDWKGTEKMSKAKVYTDQDIAIESILWLGLLANVVDRVNPLNNPGYGVVQSFSKVPDLKAIVFLRTAIL